MLGNSSICPTCGVEVSSKKMLKNHIKVHSGETHTCDQCQKSFSTKDYLKKHEKRVHGEKSLLM